MIDLAERIGTQREYEEWYELGGKKCLISDAECNFVQWVSKRREMITAAEGNVKRRRMIRPVNV